MFLTLNHICPNIYHCSSMIKFSIVNDNPLLRNSNYSIVKKQLDMNNLLSMPAYNLLNMYFGALF